MLSPCDINVGLTVGEAKELMKATDVKSVKEAMVRFLPEAQMKEVLLSLTRWVTENFLPRMASTESFKPTYYVIRPCNLDTDPLDAPLRFHGVFLVVDVVSDFSDPRVRSVIALNTGVQLSEAKFSPLVVAYVSEAWLRTASSEEFAERQRTGERLNADNADEVLLGTINTFDNRTFAMRMPIERKEAENRIELGAPAFLDEQTVAAFGSFRMTKNVWMGIADPGRSLQAIEQLSVAIQGGGEG